MKKLILSLTLAIAMIFGAQAQSQDIEKLKAAVKSELLSSSENDAIIENIVKRYYPNGAETDQCVFELVARPIPSNEEIKSIISSMSNDGSWSDIEYDSQTKSAWPPQRHVENIMKFARCYRSEKSAYYNSPELLEATLKALTYWCDKRIPCQNWWYNAIGAPKVLAPAVLLLEDKISDELMAKCITVLDEADRRMTGQNKVWVDGVTFIKGLLLADTSILERTSASIREELVVTSEEGIQYDYSYHQHGAIQQFGNYGLAFASSQSYWMMVFNDTAYDFSDEQKEILRNYFTKGINITVWKGYMDVSSCGRQLFLNSQAGKAASLMTSNLNMIHSDKLAQQQYEDYVTRNYVGGKENNLIGNFAFPISKYTIHRGADYLFSVKMFSKRIMGGEITNNENLKGYHLSDGCTMIYRTGEEYDNIFPVWDGRYMPGTTVEKNDEPLKIIKHSKEYVNGSDFVGCLSAGESGVAAIEYIRNGVHANKSWFFIGDQVVCLGNSITDEGGEPLVTTLNQCTYQDATLYLDGKKSREAAKDIAYSATKVYSDEIGYQSLDGAPIEFIIKEQSGDWHDVAGFLTPEIVKDDIFTAQIHHKAGEVGSYAYVVKPSISQKQLFNSKDSNNFVVVQNDAQASIVESKDGKTAMVILWAAGEVASSKLQISASAPMMAVIEIDGKEVSCKTYDPFDSNATLTATLR